MLIDKYYRSIFERVTNKDCSVYIWTQRLIKRKSKARGDSSIARGRLPFLGLSSTETHG